MQKNEIKNFVCSFILSLLAVAAVGKAVLRAPSEPSKNVQNDASKIQNISLFRESQDPEPNTEAFALDDRKAETVDLSALETLVAAPEKTPDQDQMTPVRPSQDRILAAREETPLLNILPKTSQKEDRLPVYTPEPDVATDLASAEEMTLDNEEEPAFEAPTPVQTPQVVLADISDTLEDEKTQNPIARTTVYMPEDEALEQKKESETVLASLEPTENLDDLSTVGLIPLEESTAVQHAEINVLNSSSASQIAMLEPTALVNTIDTYDDQPEPTLDEANLKTTTVAVDDEQDSPWVVAESHPEESVSSDTAAQSDSPWVVARGNRFAKNRAVVEQYAEPEEDETPTATEPVAEKPAELNEPTERTDELKDTVQTSKTESAEADDAVRTAQNETFMRVHENLQPQPLLKPIEGETKLAYKMIDNLLIPIPDDIKNDANLVPDLSVTPQDKTGGQSGIRRSPVQPGVVPTPTVAQPPVTTKKETSKKKKSDLNEEEKDTGLFKSIAGWFSSKSDETKAETKEEEQTPKKKKDKKTKKTGIGFFETKKNNTEDVEEAPVIMPAELRLSFQPNRAEISGQTLRWIHAFADNARDHDGIYVEIRIDGTSSFALQQKRLKLLSTILAKRGVDYRKINIVFTSREPNSFIIRNIRFSNRTGFVDDDKADPKTYQSW